MRSQAQIAIDNATVIVFLCDIKTGMTASDQEVASMLQRLSLIHIYGSQRGSGPWSESAT